MSEQPSARPRVSGRKIFVAALLDVLFVVAFAALGRAEHGGTVEVGALWQAAWPFLAALALNWVFARVWRQPFAVVESGIVLWIGTVAIGMTLRVLFTDGGAALPFILVATGVLGLTLVGWRVLVALVGKRRNRE